MAHMFQILVILKYMCTKCDLPCGLEKNKQFVLPFNLIQWTLFYSLLDSLINYREMDYDGIVLESWSRWAAYGILHDPEMRNMVNTIFSNGFYFLLAFPTLLISFSKFLLLLISVVKFRYFLQQLCSKTLWPCLVRGNRKWEWIFCSHSYFSLNRNEFGHSNSYIFRYT